MIYPWQQQAWQRLTGLTAQGRLPHALLFSGSSGLGKTDCAKHFIRSLLCATPKTMKKETACCHACRLFAGNTHPDVLILAPEGKSQIIKIEQIRQAIEFVNQTSAAGGYRFVLIEQADNMNVNAANALLKTLEEPAPGAVLILIANQTSRLPATVISRCQHVHFVTPPTDQALAWLKDNINLQEDITCDVLLANADGAPLQAKAWATPKYVNLRKSVFTVLSEAKPSMILECANWVEEEVSVVLALMLNFALDVAWLQLGALKQQVRNTDYINVLSQAAGSQKYQHVLHFLQRMQWYNHQLALNINLNKQLMYENLLISWHGLEEKTC